MAFIRLFLRAEMVGRDVALNVNFQQLCSVLSWNLMNILFASQWLEWNMKLLTMSI